MPDTSVPSRPDHGASTAHAREVYYHVTGRDLESQARKLARQLWPNVEPDRWHLYELDVATITAWARRLVAESRAEAFREAARSHEDCSICLDLALAAEAEPRASEVPGQ